MQLSIPGRRRLPAPPLYASQTLEGGRGNLSSRELRRPPSSLPGPQRAPRGSAARQLGARASPGSARAGAPAPASLAALAARLPGNTNQMPASGKDCEQLQLQEDSGCWRSPGGVVLPGGKPAAFAAATA